MIVAELTDGVIVLSSDTEESTFRQKERIKMIPSFRWDTRAQRWWAPPSWAACIQLRAIFEQELQVGPELTTWAIAEVTHRVNPALQLRNAHDADLPMFGKLYPFQRAGVAFMYTAGGALNADEMGCGKSVQALATLELIGPDAFPALIVCPNSMKFTWADEVARWAPGHTAVVITGTPAKRAKQVAQLAAGEADVGIINYEALRSHTRLAGYGQIRLDEKEQVEKDLNAVGFKTVIADEAHKAKDPHSKQTRALWYMGDRAVWRFALTGTPVANSPEDIWSLMRFVSPVEYPKKSAFIERYALQTMNLYGYPVVAGIKPEHSEELFKFLDPRLIRRLKAAVLPDLPPKVYSTRTVRMETPGGTKTKQGQAYDKIKKSMAADLDGGVLLVTDAMQQALRLCQFASACGEMVDNGRVSEDGSTLLDLKLTEPSCKVDALEEILLEVGEEQVVVFAESRQLIEIAAARLEKLSNLKTSPFFGLRFGLVTGSVSPEERAQNVRNFQDGSLKVLLLTLGAGGEGLTLTAANTAVFLQRSWNAVLNSQAEDRIHRIGQEAQSVNIIDIVTADTIEDRVRDVLANKAAMLEEIVRDQATLLEWLR